MINTNNPLFWTWNVPLGMGQDDEGNLYVNIWMPRKGTVIQVDLTECLGPGETVDQFLENAAVLLEHGAERFRSQIGSSKPFVYHFSKD